MIEKGRSGRLKPIIHLTDWLDSFDLEPRNKDITLVGLNRGRVRGDKELVFVGLSAFGVRGYKELAFVGLNDLRVRRNKELKLVGLNGLRVGAHKEFTCDLGFGVGLLKSTFMRLGRLGIGADEQATLVRLDRLGVRANKQLGRDTSRESARRTTNGERIHGVDEFVDKLC